MAEKRKWPIVLNVTIKPLEERHFVTLAIIAIIVGMLAMAREDPGLWDVELFKTLLTAFGLTGFLNMVLAYHFAANKADDVKTANTSKAFDAIRAASENSDGAEGAKHAARDVADAAQRKADDIAGEADGGELPAGEKLP